MYWSLNTVTLSLVTDALQIPCKHVFCYSCAKTTDKSCPRSVLTYSNCVNIGATCRSASVTFCLDTCVRHTFCTTCSANIEVFFINFLPSGKLFTLVPLPTSSKFSTDQICLQLCHMSRSPLGIPQPQLPPPQLILTPHGPHFIITLVMFCGEEDDGRYDIVLASSGIIDRVV